MNRVLALLALLAVSLTAPGSAADYISIRGSAVVNRVLELANADIKSALDIEFKPIIDGGSAEPIGQMIAGSVDLAMTPRHMTPQEQSIKPDKQYHETVIGYQALIIIVSDELWKAGVHSATKAQLRALYELDSKNWRDLGGPNRPVVFYNRTSTYGVWDQYMMFLYGDVRKGGISKSEAIENGEEAKAAVQFNTTAYSILEFSIYKEGEGVHALGIKQDDGSIIEPTMANLVNGKYEMIRPLVFSVDRQPTGKVREFLDYLISDKGQAYVKKAGYVTNAEYDAEAKKAK